MSALTFLYKTAPGRVCLKALTRPGLSRFVGKALDSPASKCLIRPFVEKNHIDLAQFEADHFTCFNDCFCRRIKPGLRPVDMAPEALIAPCDGLLTVYPITKGTVLPIKQSAYTVERLLGGNAVYREFLNGTALVFRLCVDNYHRYCYVDSGVKGDNIFIPGRLHTVRPIALETVPVFTENCREYTVIDTDHFGRLVQMEVGAMLVGKIRNHHGPGPVEKGREKGTFLYGGSTVVVLLREDAALADEVYIKNSQAGVETPVQYGQRIGMRLLKEA